jgi:hypothetical protein
MITYLLRASTPRPLLPANTMEVVGFKRKNCNDTNKIQKEEKKEQKKETVEYPNTPGNVKDFGWYTYGKDNIREEKRRKKKQSDEQRWWTLFFASHVPLASFSLSRCSISSQMSARLIVSSLSSSLSLCCPFHTCTTQNSSCYQKC